MARLLKNYMISFVVIGLILLVVKAVDTYLIENNSNQTSSQNSSQASER